MLYLSEATAVYGLTRYGASGQADRRGTRGKKGGKKVGFAIMVTRGRGATRYGSSVREEGDRRAVTEREGTWIGKGLPPPTTRERATDERGRERQQVFREPAEKKEMSEKEYEWTIKKRERRERVGERETSERKGFSVAEAYGHWCCKFLSFELTVN
jgi:hypothetical protein